MIFTNALNPNFKREEILTVKIAAPSSRPNFITLPALPRVLKNFPVTDNVGGYFRKSRENLLRFLIKTHRWSLPPK